MAAKRKRYPFLFYGVNPSAWFDPEAGAFAYELCFREPPPPGARPKLADALRQALRGRAEASAPWRWAGGRWALARLRPTSDGPDGARAAFAAADAALREVHALAPLEHAALLDALDLGDDPWDAWTLEAQPAPAPGPRWPHPITLSPEASRPDWPFERGPDGGDDESDDESDGPAAADDDGDEPAAADDDNEAGDDGDGGDDENDEPAAADDDGDKSSDDGDESSDEDDEDDGDRESGDEDDESGDEDGDGDEDESDDAGAGDDESDEAANGGDDATEAGGGESDES
ncbi:MAG TPA: hypothetical protein VFS00_04925, partial [Polyangiaceae bacterium]|nr:hypothetical protein [Polyangiaceae bacterium]